MKDYRVEVKIRNANILRAMEARGFKSVAELCRATGTEQGTVGDILNLKRSPIGKKGDWTPTVLKICEYLNVMPVDLFSEEQIQRPLKTNKSFVDIGFEDISRMLPDPQNDPHTALENREKAEAVDEALNSLTPKEKKVLSLRFGIDGATHTQKEIGDILGLDDSSISQIEIKALRKLRHTSKSAKMRQFLEGYENDEDKKRVSSYLWV